MLTPEQHLRRLQRPGGPVDVVMDTDTYNEIDDQYALAYLIRSPEKLRLQRSMPRRSSTASPPARRTAWRRAMRRSAACLISWERNRGKGMCSAAARPTCRTNTRPVDSPAARDLVRRAMARTPEEGPLYVIATGAITNVASALLLEPSLADRIVVVWLGGNAMDWPDAREFNLQQDVAAGRVLFLSGAPVVQLPCMGVVSAFTTTGPELRHWLSGKNSLCDYLVDVTEKEAEFCSMGPCWSRPIWDVTAVAWLSGRVYGGPAGAMSGAAAGSPDEL